MPCAFHADRPSHFEDLGQDCQFQTFHYPTFERRMVELDGQDWCPFHLPIKSADGAEDSPKAGWNAKQIDEFYRSIFSFIDAAKKYEKLADLTGVLFPGDTDFTRYGERNPLPEILFVGARFSGSADFSRARFSKGVWFTGVHFENTATFNGAQFGTAAEFIGARFENTALFHGASFSDAKFRHVFFGGDARFDQARFTGDTWFEEAQFGSDARFDQAWFGNSRSNRKVLFSGVRFDGTAQFGEASFHVSAEFTGTQFKGDADFSGVAAVKEESGGIGPKPLDDRFPSRLEFKGAHFENRASFADRKFLDKTDFSGAVFRQAPDFHGSTLHQDTDFRGTKFRGARGGEATRAYRTLKLAAEGLRDRQQEARFFALEQKSLLFSRETGLVDKVFSFPYWLLSNYGQSVWQSLVVLIALQFVFAWLYPEIFPELCSMSFEEALQFSLQQVFRPFQIISEKGRSLPLVLTSIGQSLATYSLFALFVLALRRRFRMG